MARALSSLLKSLLEFGLAGVGDISDPANIVHVPSEQYDGSVGLPMAAGSSDDDGWRSGHEAAELAQCRYELQARDRELESCREQIQRYRMSLEAEKAKAHGILSLKTQETRPSVKEYKAYCRELFIEFDHDGKPGGTKAPT